MNDLNFRCKICGRSNTCARTTIQRGTPTRAGCRCARRTRAVVGLPSRAGFGHALAIDRSLRRKDVRGIEVGDGNEDARRFATGPDYTNTYDHRSRRLDARRVAERLSRTLPERRRRDAHPVASTSTRPA